MSAFASAASLARSPRVPFVCCRVCAGWAPDSQLVHVDGEAVRRAGLATETGIEGLAIAIWSRRWLDACLRCPNADRR